jgi:hypothetical protein
VEIEVFELIQSYRTLSMMLYNTCPEDAQIAMQNKKTSAGWDLRL